LLKSCLDALTFGGLYEDDSLVKKLLVEMLEPMPPDGMLVVKVSDDD
jgi:Holliday junction resolvase RusA-like endonuclease